MTIDEVALKACPRNAARSELPVPHQPILPASRPPGTWSSTVSTGRMAYFSSHHLQGAAAPAASQRTHPQVKAAEDLLRMLWYQVSPCWPAAQLCR